MFAPLSRDYYKTPGVPGARLRDTEVEPIVIRQPIAFKARDDIADLNLKDELVRWLITDKPVPLEFDDEPGRTYFAVVQNSIDDLQKLSIMRQGTIEFLCLDPYSYGEDVNQDFVDGIAVIDNKGTAEASPVIEIEVQGDITHLDIMSEDKILRLGEAASIEKPVFEPLTKILDLPLTNTIGWTNMTSLDHGYVGGTMGASAPLGFRPSTYGAAQLPHNWQGPALRRTLPDPMQDFRIDLDVELINSIKQTGMIELYGLDALNQVVFVLGIEDVKPSESLVQGKFQVGGRSNRLHDFSVTPKSPRAWNDFKGTIRIHRRGNKITPYWALIDEHGDHVWRYSSHSYIDTQNRNTSPLTQLVIAMRVWPPTTVADMAARNLKVYRYNNEPEGIPIIAKQGDTFKVNMEDSLVLLNGEEFSEVAFGSDFFDLDKGINVLLMEPSDKLTGKVSYKERYR